VIVGVAGSLEAPFDRREVTRITFIARSPGGAMNGVEHLLVGAVKVGPARMIRI